VSKLARANLLVLGLLVLHVVDHGANQPSRDLPGSSSLVGAAGFIVVAASSVLAIRRSELAATASLFSGLATIFGFVVVHLLPNWWSWVSDPFWSFHPSALSWILLAAPILAAVYLSVLAAREIRPYAEQPG
jgi:hypothetical protein